MKPDQVLEKICLKRMDLLACPFLHKYLYPLYGFDILNHLVYDVYHTIPLNVIKNQIVRALDLEMLDKAGLDKQIENFPWTGEFKDGRLPDNLENIAKALDNGTLKATRSSLF